VPRSSSPFPSRGRSQRFPSGTSPPGFQTGRNTGALGRNLAVRRADTPYVAFSDDDSWWTQGAFRQAADLLDRHPRLGLLAARTLVGPDRTEDPFNAVLAASPLPREADLPGRSVLGFLACACVVRRDAYLGAGGYHPLLFFGGEETLIAYDLAADGWEVVGETDSHPHPFSLMVVSSAVWGGVSGRADRSYGFSS
jgi:hypothetical protein